MLQTTNIAGLTEEIKELFLYLYTSIVYVSGGPFSSRLRTVSKKKKGITIKTKYSIFYLVLLDI